MSRLEGRVAVITGGATGIGLACARRFVDEGAFVYLFGRRESALEDAVQALGPKARGVRGDVMLPEDLHRLFKAVRDERGRLDIMLANAAAASLSRLGEIRFEEYQRIFGVNVAGTLFTVQQALPLMRAGGSIIMTGSTGSAKGTAGTSLYSGSKAAIRNFARCWAQDLRGSGIRVNVLTPGPTRTEALLRWDPAMLAALAAATAMDRMADPAEIAAVAAFLASDDSSFMTGAEVFVDGGHAQI